MKYFLIKSKVLLILIILLAALLRFYQLGKNPPSLFVDEVSNGYNAYSILKTAKDEYGNFLPVTIRAFGDYNPALSVYLLVPSIAAFGLNEFAVRFPSAILGTLTVLLTYFLIKKLFFADQIPIASSSRGRVSRQRAVPYIDHTSNMEQSLRTSTGGPPKARLAFSGKETTDRTRSEAIALLSSFFLAISPWHLQFSRYDHEANFMTFFSILGLVLFLYSFKKYPLFVASSVSFGIALNTYHGAKIWVPLFLLCIFYWYKKEILSFGSKLLFPVLILAIFTLPIIGNFPQSLIRGESVGIFQNEKPLKTFISGYLSHYSPNFLFISGDPIGRHSVVGMGQLYIFELPLILLGLIALIQARTRDTKFFLAWLLLAPIPSAMATPTPHALRSITFLPVWSIIAAYGAGSFAAFRIGNRLKLSIALIVALLGLYNFATYLHLYYKHEPKLKSPDWSDGYKEMVSYVVKVAKNYEIITISNYYGRPYVFVLFYSEYDPRLYQPQSADKEKFDKYEFFGTSWEKKTPGKVLVVRPKWQIPNPAPKYLKFIHGTSGDLIFRISEE